VSKKKPAAGKGQKGKGAAAAGSRNTGEIRLSEHPRASQQIRAAKSWAGLGGLALAGYASWHAGAPAFDTALRALLWGVAAYMLVWFCAVQVWRHLAVAEVRAAEKMWLARKAEVERLARERAAQAEQAAAMAGSPRR
jgi:hypothetical protein